MFWVAGFDNPRNHDVKATEYRIPNTENRASAPVNLVYRTWRDAPLTHAPVCCSVELPDGNQAPIDLMNSVRKLRQLSHTSNPDGVAGLVDA